MGRADDAALKGRSSTLVRPQGPLVDTEIARRDAWRPSCKIQAAHSEPLFLSFLDELNPQQREAVETTEGPVLILAGAGSGKTRVITYRIAYLIEKMGVMPESILAVTFTNKAAAEMVERVEKLVGGLSIAKPVISTFHSFCVRLLRRDIEALRIPSSVPGRPAADHLSSRRPA